MKNITLRIPTWEDMKYIRWLWSDPETMEPVGGPVPLSDQGALRWYTRIIDPGDPGNCYRLVINESGEPVGEVSFHHLDPATMLAKFNIKIAANMRGRGYAHQAMQLFLDHFFTKLGGLEMVDDIALENRRGQQVLLDFGFTHDPMAKDVFLVRMTRNKFIHLYGAR